jgi:plasmid stability protein
MATITVRNLDDDVQQRIKLRAAANNRSMEAEAREILRAAVMDRGLGAWIAATEGLRGDDLPIPPRSPAREIDLS